MFQLRTVLKGCPSCTATCGVSWGFPGTALQLSFYLCPILLHSLLCHEYWSWTHSSVSFPHTNLLFKLCFWGNPIGDNRILSPVSWTHYMLVTRHITNYSSSTCQKDLYMSSLPQVPRPFWSSPLTFMVQDLAQDSFTTSLKPALTPLPFPTCVPPEACASFDHIFHCTNLEL